MDDMLSTAHAPVVQEVGASTANVELDDPVRPTAESTEDTVLEGKEAWQRLQNDPSWQDWLAVGKAHVIGRGAAMREARVNVPKGSRYNSAFTAWQFKCGFENLDSGDRCRLFAVIDHLAEIEAWRQTLTPCQRAGLNHPSTVLRRWKAATKAPKEKIAPQSNGHQVGRRKPQTGNLNPLTWANASPAERHYFINSIGWRPIAEAIPADWRPTIRRWLDSMKAPGVIDHNDIVLPNDLSIPTCLKRSVEERS